MALTKLLGLFSKENKYEFKISSIKDSSSNFCCISHIVFQALMVDTRYVGYPVYFNIKTQHLGYQRDLINNIRYIAKS